MTSWGCWGDDTHMQQGNPGDLAAALTRLILKWPDGERTLDRELLIGTDRNRCDITLDDPAVAPVQCVLLPRDNEATIVNLREQSPVRVDTWTVHGRYRVSPGQLLRIGDVELHLESVPDLASVEHCQLAATATVTAAAHLPAITPETLLDHAAAACPAHESAILERTGEHAWTVVAGAARLPREIDDTREDDPRTSTHVALLAGLRCPELARTGVSRALRERDVLSSRVVEIEGTGSALVARLDVEGRAPLALVLTRHTFVPRFGERDRVVLQQVVRRLARRLISSAR
jgi:hypothetical protein